MKGFGYGGTELGGFAQPAAIDPKTKTRSYAGNAYYSPDISCRANLRVVTEALVSKIDLEKKGAEVVAKGVQFSSVSGHTFTLRVSKEVILAAGVVQSPQLLELSGIGSRTILEQHGIPIIISNPQVGENLQDHAMVPISFEVKDSVQTAEPMLRDPSIFLSLLETYQRDRSGPLGQFFADSAQCPLPEAFGSSGGAIYSDIYNSLPRQNGSDSHHDNVTLKLLAQEDGASAHYFMAKTQFNVAGSHKIGEWTVPKTPGKFLTPMVGLNFPFSRGSVHIASSSPNDKPVIDPKYMEHAMDMELMARHVQFFHTLITTPPLSGLFKTGGARIPEHAFAKLPTLDECKALVRETMISNYHPMGTCRMGRDSEGVVDERLVVRGTRNLRVVDASVFPLMPRGNPITSVYAVAERAADLVKESWI